MDKTLEQLYTLLDKEDEVTVLELLDLTSPELVQAYKYKVRQRHDYISKFYQGTEDEEEDVYFKEEKHPRGLGDRSTWTDAGFQIEDEDF